MTSNFARDFYSMKRQVLIILLFLCIFNFTSRSQEKVTVEEYINLYADLAVKEMINYHIPASITLAQGLLESENGNSPLAIEANNHFGIKCHEEWTGKTYNHDDDVKNECFRKYKKVEDSFRDHSEFLTTRDRYKSLFDLSITDYKGWAYGLKQAGYATNPRYPEILIRIIEENGLFELDRPGGRQLAVGNKEPAVGSQQSNPGTHKSELKTPNSELSTQNSEIPAVFEIAGRGGNDRIIFLNNDVKFILAREGDDFGKIAGEFGIYSWQIREYNDLTSSDKISRGQKVYLERKKKKAKFEYHVMGPEETLYSVAQDYGIRLNVLCRINERRSGDEVEEGEKLKLK
jgi:LysM repeat protein